MKKVSIWKFLLNGTMAVLLVGTAAGQSADNGSSAVLESGQAIRAASPGNFALPSLSGYVMGTAVLEKDDARVMFLRSDKRNAGTFLYYLQGFTGAGAPVFSKGLSLKIPLKEEDDNRGCILQDQKKRIWGFWQKGKNILIYQFNSKTFLFEHPRTVKVEGLPAGMSSFGVAEVNDKFVFLFGVPAKTPPGEVVMKFDSLYYTPEGVWPVRLPTTGIYGAIVDDFTRITTIQAGQLTSSDEIYYQFSGYTFFENAGSAYAIAGTRMGDIYAYRIHERPFSLEKKYVVDTTGIIQRHPGINAFPGYLHTKEGHQGFIASGEGGIYYYENLLKTDRNGNAVFGKPVPALQEDPVLYGGSLVVPNLVDWDGDGLIDIISGSSDGRIRFFRNAGTNESPLYQASVNLQAGGREIHVQPGYREDIQGPGEGRWGYTCPTVVDWNEDGLPDLLTGDSRGKFMVFINRGTRTNPVLDPEHTLYFKGMDVHGSWRVKPGAGILGDRMAYIILDTDNEFHLYWKLDDYNLEDGGKLTLADQTFIKANRRPGGQVGRAKIHLVDWDEDGVTDMLVGTGRSASIPNPETGLPYNRKKKNEGAAVLFLRNAGTNDHPVFEYPKMLRYKGKEMLFGAHSCSPTTARIGKTKTLNLVVGIESGQYMFYDKKDLSW